MHFGCAPALVIGEDDGVSVERAFEKSFEFPNGGFPKVHAERSRLQRRVARNSKSPLENRLGAVAAEILPVKGEDSTPIVIADDALPHLDERLKEDMHSMAVEIDPILL